MPDDVSALQLLLRGDPALLAIVRLSLLVSLSAVVLAGLVGVPFGAGVALTRFAGREVVIVVLNALMGLPPWGSLSICCCRARVRSDRGACCSRRRR
jgi:tungstate transport system permease protein